MTDDRIARMRGILGLAQRAGRLQTGADLTAAALRGGKAYVALVDAHSSANTVKKARDACIYYHVPLIVLESGLLAQSCGRAGRMLGAVTDQGFARQLLEIWQRDGHTSIKEAMNTQNAGVQASNDEG